MCPKFNELVDAQRPATCPCDAVIGGALLSPSCQHCSPDKSAQATLRLSAGTASSSAATPPDLPGKTAFYTPPFCCPGSASAAIMQDMRGTVLPLTGANRAPKTATIGWVWSYDVFFALFCAADCAHRSKTVLTTLQQPFARHLILPTLVWFCPFVQAFRSVCVVLSGRPCVAIEMKERKAWTQVNEGMCRAIPVCCVLASIATTLFVCDTFVKQPGRCICGSVCVVSEFCIGFAAIFEILHLVFRLPILHVVTFGRDARLALLPRVMRNAALSGPLAPTNAAIVKCTPVACRIYATHHPAFVLYSGNAAKERIAKQICGTYVAHVRDIVSIVGTSVVGTSDVPFADILAAACSSFQTSRVNFFGRIMAPRRSSTSTFGYSPLVHILLLCIVVCNLQCLARILGSVLSFP